MQVQQLCELHEEHWLGQQNPDNSEYPVTHPVHTLLLHPEQTEGQLEQDPTEFWKYPFLQTVQYVEETHWEQELEQDRQLDPER